MKNPKTIESRIREVADFASGTDATVNEDKASQRLFEGAMWLFENATLVAHSERLLEAMRLLMDDFNGCYQSCTDNQMGNDPGTVAWRRAAKLIKKLERQQ